MMSPVSALWRAAHAALLYHDNCIWRGGQINPIKADWRASAQRQQRRGSRYRQTRGHCLVGENRGDADEERAVACPGMAKVFLIAVCSSLY